MSTIASETTTTWTIDPVHSTIGFAVKHLGVATFRGSFDGAAGTIESTDDQITAIDGSVEIANVHTREANLAGHLQSPDFFDAAQSPTASFTSTAIEQSAGEVVVTGDLTLRGVTRPVELRGDVALTVDPYGNDRIAIGVRGQIDRTQFGVSWNAPLANGALAVAEKVTIELDVEAVRSA